MFQWKEWKNCCVHCTVLVLELSWRSLKPVARRPAFLVQIAVYNRHNVAKYLSGVIVVPVSIKWKWSSIGSKQCVPREKKIPCLHRNITEGILLINLVIWKAQPREAHVVFLVGRRVNSAVETWRKHVSAKEHIPHNSNPQIYREAVLTYPRYCRVGILLVPHVAIVSSS